MFWTHQALCVHTPQWILFVENRVWRTPAIKRAHGNPIWSCFYNRKPLSKTKGSILYVFYNAFWTLTAMLLCRRIKHRFCASETTNKPAAKNEWHILLAPNTHVNISLRDGRCRQNGVSGLVLAKRSTNPWLKKRIGNQFSGRTKHVCFISQSRHRLRFASVKRNGVSEFIVFWRSKHTGPKKTQRELSHPI